MVARRFLVGLCAGVAAGLCIGSALAGPAEDRVEQIKDKFLTPLVWLVAQVEQRYVEPPDHRRLLVGIYQGMLSELDAYSGYWPRETPEGSPSRPTGELAAPDFQMRFRPVSKMAILDQSVPGTHAFEEGLLPGDLLVAFKDLPDGEVCKTEDFDGYADALRVLRGEPGSKVEVTVLLPESGEERKVTFTRGSSAVRAVFDARIVDREAGIGLVRVGFFGEQTARELEKAINSLQGQGMSGLVLDLRFNPGGLRKAARECLDMFLDGGEMFTTKGRAVPARTFYAAPGKEFDMPMVVLVNRFTASWAEVVTAALRDNGRAKVVGEQTMGRANVQSAFPGPGDDGIVRLTTAWQYRPAGEPIEGNGIEPDVEAKLSREQTRTLAIYIAHGGKLPPEVEKALGGADSEAGEGEAPEKEEFRDVQLERAVQALRHMMSAPRLAAGTGAPDENASGRRALR